MNLKNLAIIIIMNNIKEIITSIMNISKQINKAMFKKIHFLFHLLLTIDKIKLRSRHMNSCKFKAILKTGIVPTYKNLNQIYNPQQDY